MHEFSMVHTKSICFSRFSAMPPVDPHGRGAIDMAFSSQLSIDLVKCETSAACTQDDETKSLADAIANVL
jgi:hypothetical protein